MKTLSYTTIDRAAKGWPSGPWDGEPDKVQWQDEATGLPCLAVRQGNNGHWCGYVGVAEDHPYFGHEYDEHYELPAHGGLTFSDACSPGETEATGICHLPEPGEPDHVWWFGFDCAHHGDSSPRDAALYGDFTGYKTLDYVQASCRELAAALKAVAT